MKILAIVFLFTLAQSFAVTFNHVILQQFLFIFLQFLQIDFLSLSFTIDPKYGNASMAPSNSTHGGSLTLWLFQKIPNFIVKTAFMSAEGKSIVNNTSKPCEQKNASKLKKLIESVMKLPKQAENETVVKCPLEQVS